MESEVTFIELIEKAKQVYNPRKISSFIEAGGVSAAILTEDNNIYIGVCIDTACSLGMCAERNAIANMITNSESRIKKLVCYGGENIILSPCGACREYLMQLDKESGNIEILKDIHEMKTVKLGDLVPDWWGTRFESRY
ncbi:cytidine deaminase family protein [Cellulosispirillum alkaliphilum]|uniref:cytidine deaminase family protein n=1 Tax=Cellulosispirillum alkaliphilum TaxID=3039283 RepID=UPI003D6EAB53